MRIWLTTLLTLLALSAATASAQTTATTSVDEVARALAADPVYVDPDAEAALSDAEAADLRRRLQGGTAGRVFVAILPEAAREPFGGDPRQLAQALASAVGQSGSYIVVSGRNVQLGSDAVEGEGAIVDAAIARNDGLPAILDDIVTTVARERLVGGGAREPSNSGGPTQPGGGGTTDGSGGLVVLGVLALGGGALVLSRRARRRREEAAELAHVKDQIQDELVELGDGIRALDLDIEMPGVDPAAREDYERAVGAYDRANTAWNTARTVDGLEPVGSALEEGRWALQSARARLEGRQPPERTPPCFFDPRHGPSYREVEWAPPGGTPRPVPACEADAQAVERGIDPGFREIDAGGQMVPYWAAGPAYSPFYGRGMFGGFGTGLAGGLLGGMLLGEMLDGPDSAYADTGFGDGGGDFGGGDFGGGGFGGGDFGGGGGDFGGGGGDFGGGDF